MLRRFRSVACGLALATLAGCLSQAPPVAPRYFEPRVDWASADQMPPGEGALRLERVASAPLDAPSILSPTLDQRGTP